MSDPELPAAGLASAGWLSVYSMMKRSVLQGLQALAWLSAKELSGHPNGDAFLVGPWEGSAQLIMHLSVLVLYNIVLIGNERTCLHAPVLTWQACQCRQLPAALERSA